MLLPIGRHPLSGEVAAGRVLVVPFSRGSSTTTAVLLEAARAGTAPAAIVTTGVDSFFALASIVARELYGRPIPIVAVTPGEALRQDSRGLDGFSPDGPDESGQHEPL